MLPPLLAGFGLGLSLIVAIGAQNLVVRRQGIRRQFARQVAAVCALSDAALIVVGVSGLGAILHAAPWLIDAVRWAGAVFLAGYAVLAARRALQPHGDALRAEDEALPVGNGALAVEPQAAAGIRETPSPRRDTTRHVVSHPERDASRPGAATPARLGSVLLTCLALTWLNPHVYLDTVFLLGSVAAAQDDGRWWFAAGAVAASVVWFFSLALGARYLGRWLATPRAWRVLDGLIAVVMLALAISLVWPR